jgi:hypothetical protein
MEPGFQGGNWGVTVADAEPTGDVGVRFGIVPATSGPFGDITCQLQIMGTPSGETAVAMFTDIEALHFAETIIEIVTSKGVFALMKPEGGTQ